LTTLFNRAATLIVGKTKTTGTKYAGFRISFEVDKTSESTPNPAKVSIYNLSRDTRSALEQKGLIMILEAGYSGIEDEPNVAQLFVGDVRRVKTVRQGPDLITTLEAGDEEVKLTTTHVDQSFKEFTSVTTVVQSLASKLGVGIGTISAAVKDVFQNGVSLSGLVSTQLDVITKKIGVEWSVTDGQLNILAPTESTTEPAVLLDAFTGLIGFPCKRHDGDEKTKSFTGIEFSSLLNPEIRPGRAVQIVSGEIQGIFRVRRARYRGDTHGGDWRVDVEAVQ
jgi:hypothetical protein